MEQLDVMQRLHYYRRALKECRTHYMRPFLCNVLKYMLVEDGLLRYHYSAEYVAAKYFPEFWQEMQHEGDTGNTAPWPDNEDGYAIRDRVLNSCINNILEGSV